MPLIGNGETGLGSVGTVLGSVLIIGGVAGSIYASKNKVGYTRPVLISMVLVTVLIKLDERVKTGIWFSPAKPLTAAQMKDLGPKKPVDMSKYQQT